MDEINEQSLPEQEGNTPRPGWQIWGARIGLVLFLLLVALQILLIARGGIL